MTCNSIYGNTFKIKNQNNLVKVPDFFLKLFNKAKNGRESNSKMILNRSHNKYDINKVNNLQSYENNIKNITKKKYDINLCKKNELFRKRKNSAFNLLKFRKNKIIEDQDNEVELINNKNQEKINETDVTEKNKNNGIKYKSQSNIKNKSFYFHNSQINYELDNINKKNNLTNFPFLSNSPKKIYNNMKEFENNYKESFLNIRNFLGHLNYMNKKYKLNQNIPQNLILSSSKYTTGNSSSDSFKEQVNSLINKLKNKNKNKENIHRKTLNLCVVNVGSPLYNFHNNVISFTRNVQLNKKSNIDDNKNIKYINIEQSKDSKPLDKLEVQKEKITRIVNTNLVNNNKNKIVKINNNILQNIKKYKTQTDFNQDNIYYDRNEKNVLTKSNSSKFEYKNIQRKKMDFLSKKYNLDKNAIKLNLNLIHRAKNLAKIDSSDKNSENLFLNQYITNDFDRRFSYYDTYYYKLNKMYYDQISDYMSHRINWELIEADDFEDSYYEQSKQINFEWKYYPNRLYYKKYKYTSSTPIKKLCAINLFEKNYEIGNKKKMFIHLINYCDNVNLNVFEYIPFTVIINNTRFIDDELLALKEIMNLLKINKYKNITKNINSDFTMDKKYNEQFWFDNKLESLQNQKIYINKNFLSHKNYWMIKPTDLYQGKCIEISNSFNEIAKNCKKMFTGVDKTAKPESLEESKKRSNNDDILNSNLLDSYNDSYEYDYYIRKKKKKSKIYISSELIIQKYLDNPLLYRKRKFDIRCFALVDWNLNVFFCREGHLKASSFIYDVNNINKFIHITNHSFQKKSKKFEQYETGNEISYSEFKNFLLEENIPLSNFDKIIEKMKFIVKLSFQAVNNKIMRTPDVLSFELFGYDFIIDNEYNPWLLEINNNPGLSISSPVIEKIIPRMMDDAFRLTIDKIFNTKYSSDCFDKNKNYKSKFKLDGYSDYENIFEFLCNVKTNDNSKNDEET